MTAKILVVDDEADLELLIKQKFRKQIRENLYEFVFAGNGFDALEQLQKRPDIDIVLSDINMPGMDGLALLAKLHEASPLVKTVIVSAYGDMENIRTAMNRGAFDFICKPVNFSDLEVTMQKTISYVNQLHDTIRAIKENNILRMYVDESVLNFMSRQSDSSLFSNETIEATVAFFDICGFTAITENIPANTVVSIINKYFDLMVKEIIAQKGYVDKFIGDAVMAVFRGPYHLDRAVEASIAVRNLINSISEPVSSFPDYEPKVSIGINSGEMVSGNIGSASLKRLDYTVIGHTVNLAQRLQSIAQPGQIIITEDAYQQIKDSFRCQLVGEVKLKNKAKPVVTYQVLE